MKTLKLLFVFTLLVFFFSCDKEVDKIDPRIATTENRQDQIEGFNFLTPCEASNITFTINPNCVGTPYATAILEAVAAFNATPTTINFVQVFTPTADIVLNCVPGDVCGEGVWFPGSILQTIGSTINLEVMTDFCPCKENPCMFKRTVMHELGHALGLHHNGEGVHIPGTPNTGNDPNSVFNSGPVTSENGEWCTAPCEFNEGDLAALQHFYSCPKSQAINGPQNLCVNEEGSYCVDKSYCDVNWQGHPLIDGKTTNCVKLKYDQSGTDFIYADVTDPCTGKRLHLSFRIDVGPPNILSTLTVEFDPCRSLINIKGNPANPTTVFNWGSFTGMKNKPHVAMSGKGNENVTLRGSYSAGETLCFTVNAKSDCGSTGLPCQVCYKAPSCRETDGKPVVVKPINGCINGKCPEGFECNGGICCPKTNNGLCTSDSDCPPGFTCVNGECCDKSGACL